jgi:uncharacterized membrane protein YeaQ/YmgE (transglycosylase-associated protein family)
MEQTADEVLRYFQNNILILPFIAFIAGFAAVKSVSYGKRVGIVLYLVIGFLGFFLGEFLLFFSGLKEFLSENLPSFRLFFDFLAAYIGSFIVAAFVHLFRPL